MSPYVITIGRQLGSGGREVGRRLAEKLHIAYYDSEILSLAAKESGFTPDVFARMDEHRGFLQHLIGAVAPIMNTGNFYGNQMSSEHIFQLQSEAIRKAAAEQSCVFIGRGADYILRHHPRCLNIFLAAETEDRIKRVMEIDKISASEALKKIESGDNKRASFYNFYTQGVWGAASNYHICLNTSALGIDQTVQIICRIVEEKFWK